MCIQSRANYQFFIQVPSLQAWKQNIACDAMQRPPEPGIQKASRLSCKVSKYTASFCSQACLRMPQVILPIQPKIPVRKPNAPSLMYFSSHCTFKTSRYITSRRGSVQTSSKLLPLPKREILLALSSSFSTTWEFFPSFL